MGKNHSDIVEFDILLKAGASGKTPRLDNIDQFKPPAENVAKCRRWLASKGVTCHSTDFGLACSATAEIFEALFSATLERSDSGPGVPCWHCSSPPQAPQEIERYVDQISISAPPELY